MNSKESIIQAYLCILNEKHHEELSVKEIADRANISRTTFYLHFTDKNALLVEVKMKLYNKFLRFYEQQEVKNINSIHELNSFIICNHIFKYRTFYQMVFTDAMEIQYLSNLLAEKLHKIFKDQDYAIFASYGTRGYLSIWVKNNF